MGQFVDDPEYALEWPPQVFANEVGRLIYRAGHGGMNADWRNEVETLLRQAFSSEVPGQAFDETAAPYPGSSDPTYAWLCQLRNDVPALLRPQRPRPYFSERQEGPSAGPGEPTPLAMIVRRVRQLVGRLNEQHFFSQTVGYDCVDGRGDAGSSFSIELDTRVRKPQLWTNAPESWSESDLCDFIEVFYDLAARPIRETYHSYMSCGWHPVRYSRSSGQSVYLASMNELLDSTTLGLRLAEDGEDVGRMVRAPSGELSGLMSVAVAETPLRDDVAHAVALFRSRSGTRHDKRSAIVTLARILEDRRRLLKTELLSGDEGALFNIANNFDLRHQNADQRTNYDDVFLEWIFYWYLATIRLTDQLLAGQSP